MVDIARGATIYLDTNALIYMTEGSADFKQSLEEFFEQAIAATAQFVTSEPALTEALVHPIRDNYKVLLEAYNDLFEHFVEARPITRGILIRAAELRAGVRQYRTPDAIHLATAEEACAQLFVTGDRGIDILLPMHRYLLVETAAITNFARAQKFINEFKRLGCRFALDDFGNGMSSFANLKHLPVYYLKIDSAFINDIVNGPIDRAMVKAINKVAHLMGMQTIAEFVENLDQLELLREIGVDYVQRYAISRPELIFIFADAPSGARHAQLMNA